MSEPPVDSDAPDDPVDRILLEYVQAGEAGHALNQEELLARYPEYAAELAEFFANQEQFEKAVRPFRFDALTGGGESDESARRTLSPDAVNGDKTTGQDPSSQQAIMPGARVRYFGEYELIGEIARGGMGIVFKARQLRLNRTVALKMILAGQFASAEDVKRFQVEAENAAHLDHPNIVPIYDVGKHKGQHYFTMKLVEGGSLSGQADRFTGDLKTAASLLAIVARAVHYGHQRGILHRDVKPGNILLDSTGQPQVTDFGLARRMEDDHGLTLSGALVGSPRYMAPEQARSEKGLTVAVDVWGLGAVLYELLTGKPPFDGETSLRILEQVKSDEPPRPSTLNMKVGRDLEVICLKCLQKDPQRRYASAEALADDLDCWLRGSPISARPVGGVERAWRWCQRNRGLAVAAGFAVLATVATMIAMVVAVVLADRTRDANSKLASQNAQLATQERELRLQTQRHAARLEFESALSHCASDGPAEGMLWLCRSLDEAVSAGDAQLEQSVRLQLAAWSLRTCRLEAVHHFQGQANVFPCLFSRDGTKVLTFAQPAPGLKYGCYLLDSRTMHNLGPMLDIYERPLAVSPDGALVASDGDSDPTPTGRPYAVIRISDTASGKAAGAQLLGTADVSAIAFSPDGKSILAIDDEYKLIIWNLATRECIAVHDIRSSPQDLFEPKVIAVNPKGDRVALSGNSGDGNRGEVRIWDLRSWARVGKPILDEATVWRAVFLPDGKTLLTVGSWAKLWEYETGQPVGAGFSEYPSDWLRDTRALSMSLSGDGGLAILGSSNRVFKLWDVADGTPIGSPLPHSLDALVGSAFIADSENAVTMAALEALLWRLPDRSTLSSQARGKPSLPQAISSDGQMVAFLGSDGRVRCWNLNTSRAVGVAFDPGGRPVRLAVERGGEHIMVVDQSKTARVWLVSSGKPVASPASPNQSGWEEPRFDDFSDEIRDAARERWGPGVNWKTGAPGVAFNRPSPDATAVIAVAQDAIAFRVHGGVRVYSRKSGSALGPILPEIPDEYHGNVEYPGLEIFAAFSPDGHRLVTYRSIGSIRVWDFASGRLVAPAITPSGDVNGVEISADNTILLTRGNGRVCFWDLASGRPIGTPLPECLVSLAFSGHALLTTAPDGPTVMPAPAPVRGSPLRIRRWVESITGMTLGEDGIPRLLYGLGTSSDWRWSADQWQRRKDELASLGGPPL